MGVWPEYSTGAQNGAHWPRSRQATLRVVPIPESGPPECLDDTALGSGTYSSDTGGVDCSLRSCSKELLVRRHGLPIAPAVDLIFVVQGDAVVGAAAGLGNPDGLP